MCRHGQPGPDSMKCVCWGGGGGAIPNTEYSDISIRNDIKIENYLLQPESCSIQELYITFNI